MVSSAKVSLSKAVTVTLWSRDQATVQSWLLSRMGAVHVAV